MAGDINRDANFRTVCAAEGDDGVVYPWEIDSVTGRVLMEITIVANHGNSAPLTRASKDANFRDTLTGLSDSAIQPLAAAIDATNGLLGVDLFIE